MIESSIGHISCAAKGEARHRAAGRCFFRLAEGWLAALAMTTAACGGSPAMTDSAPAYYGGAGVTEAATAAPADVPMERGESTGSDESEQRAKAPPPAPKPEVPPTAGQPAPAENGQGASGTPSVGQDRTAPILIYKAEFTMSVYEVQKSLDAVQSLAERSGGYLARRDDTSITIRVPAGNFQNAVTDIEKLGDVLNRNVVSEDVTAEYRDLEVQLKNQLAMRDRFEKLLEKAQKVDEALEIERELGRVTQEIERIKGRLKLLADLAQYSTITVKFAPRVDQQLQHGPFILPLPWLDNLGLPRLMQL